jgi:hypothetical protein
LGSSMPRQKEAGDKEAAFAQFCKMALGNHCKCFSEEEISIEEQIKIHQKLRRYKYQRFYDV